MKRIIFFLAFLAFTVNSFGQTMQNPNFSKDYYLQKSKNQKNTGWVLLGGGVVMSVAGVIGFSNSFDIDIFSDDSSSDTATDAYGFLFLGGLATSSGSIPFFIGSASNARKAATITLGNQRIFLPQQNGIALGTQPAVSLKISF